MSKYSSDSGEHRQLGAKIGAAQPEPRPGNSTPGEPDISLPHSPTPWVVTHPWCRKSAGGSTWPASVASSCGSTPWNLNGHRMDRDRRTSVTNSDRPLEEKTPSRSSDAHSTPGSAGCASFIPTTQEPGSLRCRTKGHRMWLDLRTGEDDVRHTVWVASDLLSGPVRTDRGLAVWEFRGSSTWRRRCSPWTTRSLPKALVALELSRGRDCYTDCPGGPHVIDPGTRTTDRSAGGASSDSAPSVPRLRDRELGSDRLVVVGDRGPWWGSARRDVGPATRRT